MPTTTMLTKHRPIRLGLVVEQGSTAEIAKAASIASLLWGGMRNPIIPVGDGENRQAARLVESFRVDILYPVTSSAPIEQFLNRYPYLEAPLEHRRMLIEDWRTKRNTLAYLDALKIIDRYWHSDFKSRPDDYRSNCIYLSWDDGDKLSDLFAVLFGRYLKDFNLLDDFEAAYRSGLCSHQECISDEAPIPALAATHITPISLTGLDLTRYGSTFRDWSGVYVGDALDPMDLTCFWNLRAAGSEVAFLPVSESERFRDYVEAHLEELDRTPHAHPKIEDRIRFSYRHHEESVKSLFESFATKKKKGIAQCSEANWNGLNANAVQFHFDWQNALAQVDYEHQRHKITIALPEKRFLAEIDPVTDDQLLAVSVSPLGEFGYSGHTIAPPFRRDLNEFYSRKLAFDPWAIRSEPDGLAVLIGVRDRSVVLWPIEKKSVVKALLERSGMKVEASSAGILADRLLDKLGGVDGTRVFKIRGLRSLVDNLTPSHAISRGDATRSIWNDGQFKDHEQLHIEQRDAPKLQTGAVFDFMLKHEFFRAGLELRCDQCRLVGWHALRQIDDVWICEFCGYRNLTSLHIRDRGDWRFRKSGLLAKNNNQEGAIPVVLTLLVFYRLFHSRGLIYSTSLNVSGEFPCEIDFVAFTYGGPGGTECVIGEAKSEGGEIDQVDIDHMKAVRSRLMDIGLPTYLCFTKTANRYRQSEIERFLRLQDEDISPIILSNQEIEPYGPYWHEGAAGSSGEPTMSLSAPRHLHVGTLREMADVSETRYLRSGS